jgi:uncharacterized membrane protein YfcA
MVGGIPLSELAFLAGVIVAGGVITGLLAGLFGIGGGAIIVPVLYEVFRVFGVPEDVRMQLCVGTSLAIILPTNLRSYLTHRRYGAVLMEVVRTWWLPSVIGVAMGALIAAFAPGAVLKLAFVLVTGAIGLKLLLGRDDWRISNEMPGLAVMTGYGFVLGLLSSLIGVSGGSISTMFMSLHGRVIHNVVATSAALGVPITIAGTVGYMLAGLPQPGTMPPLSIGYVSLIGFALMAPVSSFTAPYGARLSHALSKRRLEVAFAIFLLTTSMRFLFSLIG